MTKMLRTVNHQGLNQVILHALTDYILEAGLKNGDKLPSQIEMAKQMNVSRTALREALAQLEARGILKQVQGVGTFVVINPEDYKTSVAMETSITEMIRAMGRVPGTAEMILEWRPLPAEFEKCFSGQEEYICLQRTRIADNEPFAISIAFLSPDLIESPDEIQMHKHNESLFEFLEEYCGEVPVYFDDQIEIVFPVEDIAKKLNIETTQPIFKFNRRQYNQDRKLLVVASDYFKLERLSLQVTRYKLSQEFGDFNKKEEVLIK